MVARSIAMETYVRLMVLKQRHRVGIPDVGWRGVGLDLSVPVLPDRVVGAGAGRVDGQEADAADRGGDGERDHCAF